MMPKEPPPTALPPSFNLFVGRTRELAEIRDALNESRLVTLMGPGGCGKTRLALEYARQSVTAPNTNRERPYKDDLIWCDLAAVTDPSFVPARLVTALNLSERANVSPAELVTAELASRQCLLMIDNCEHLLDACARLVETILAKCPHVTILATSIQPLALSQEKIYNVSPLAIPALPTAPNAETVAAYAETDAVKLFVNRAQEAFPAFDLNEQNLSAVVTICQRLDGMPLAIELAAARVKMLAPAQIAERLEDAFRLLTRGSPDALPKHQTLRAALDWSFRLLGAPEQILLRRLGVFAGSFDAEMVEAICDHDLQVPSLDVLTDLVDKSLVMIVQHQEDCVRYRLLETIRQYAREQLQQALEQETFATRLLDWCADSVEHLAPELKGASQDVHFVRLETEYDNLRAALQFALDPRRVETGFRLAGMLERFWLTRGHVSEGRYWIKRLLGVPLGQNEPTLARVKAMGVAGMLAEHQDDYDEAFQYFHQCLQDWQRLENVEGVATALTALGNVALDLRDYMQANARMQESLVLWRELGDEGGQVASLIGLGIAADEQGDFERATELDNEALAIARRIGDRWLIAVLLNNLGEVAAEQGDWQRADLLLRENLAIRRALGDHRGEGIALKNLGDVALRQNNWIEARTSYKQSLTIAQSGRFQNGIVIALEGLVLVESAQAGAGSSFDNTRARRAALLLAVAEQLRETLRAPRTPLGIQEFQALLEQLRAHLDERTFAMAWAEGRALKLDDAVAYALSEPVEILPPNVELYITAFGTGTVQLYGIPIADTAWKYVKARELFFFLLTHSHATKDQVGLALWADVSPNQLRSRLHRVLHQLRKALGKNEWILFENDEYTFNRTRAYWYDVEQFQERLRAARAALTASPPQTALAIRLLQDAAPLYSGDFLADLDAEWIVFRREESRQDALEALLQLGHLLMEQERHEEAIPIYQRLIKLDNYLEVAHRELMRCYARQGEPGRALRHFEELRELLRAEMGIEPSPETIRLVERIRQGDNM